MPRPPQLLLRAQPFSAAAAATRLRQRELGPCSCSPPAPCPFAPDLQAGPPLAQPDPRSPEKKSRGGTECSRCCAPASLHRRTGCARAPLVVLAEQRGDDEPSPPRALSRRRRSPDGPRAPLRHIRPARARHGEEGEEARARDGGGGEESSRAAPPHPLVASSRSRAARGRRSGRRGLGPRALDRRRPMQHRIRPSHRRALAPGPLPSAVGEKRGVPATAAGSVPTARPPRSCPAPDMRPFPPQSQPVTRGGPAMDSGGGW
ncbi:unnamed protein product [Urochloa humidicola]